MLWKSDKTGGFSLSAGGQFLFFGYAQAKASDGRKIDTRTARFLSEEEKDGTLRLQYEAQNGKIIPLAEIIIQQIFGCFETPRVMGMPVLLKLLSPARRPLQITSDLANFWKETWPQICSEMKGRYPKHNWDYRVASD